MDKQLDSFFRAWCSPELQLLGYRLTNPYCLGDMLLLEGLNSPFERLHIEGTNLGASDLLLALRVCSIAKFPFRYVDLRPSWRDRLTIWWLERSQKRLAEAINAFIRWRCECCLRPEFWEPEDELTGGLTAPHQLARAVKLLRATGLSEERIWTMSVGSLSWYDGASDEQESTQRRFVYDSDFDADDKLPDLSKLSDQELYELVKRDMGQDFADQWLFNRGQAAA